MKNENTTAGKENLYQILTVYEAATILRVSKSTIYDMIASGQIPHLRFGGNVRLRRHDIEKFIDGL